MVRYDIIESTLGAFKKYKDCGNTDLIELIMEELLSVDKLDLIIILTAVKDLKGEEIE